MAHSRIQGNKIMNKRYKENRHIRVFISSTFKRMEEEREMLINKTFPLLRRIAQERDVMLTEVDLRWGITPEQSQNGKVVEICLEEIENSIPFFIGIIGDRYGWIPNESDIPETTLERYDKVNAYLKRELSVTEMEMQFGVLERPENMNAYFFIKNGNEVDPEEPQHYHDKLSLLKDAVLRNTRYPVSGYSSSEDLSNQVEKCFISLIDKLFPEKSRAHEREDTLQNSVANHFCFCYVPLEDCLGKLDAFMGDRSQSILLVEGESGCGKSSLLANWAKTRDKDYTVLYHNLSACGQSEPGFAMVRRCLRLLSGTLGMDFEAEQNYEDATSSLSEVISELDGTDRNLVIILDGIDRISSTHLSQCLSWIPKKLTNIKIICSAISDSQACAFLKGREYPSLKLPSFSLAQRESLVVEYLYRYHSKRLTPTQVAAIVKAPVAGKPAILCTMLNELANYGVHETIDSFINEHLIADSDESFYEQYLLRLEQIFGKEFVSLLLGTISITKTGIPETTLIEFIGCSRMLLSQFLGYINDTVSNDNGLLKISNALLDNIAAEKYSVNNDGLCGRFISFLKMRKDSWSVIELAYQLHRQNNRIELTELLMIPENLDLLYKNDYDSLFFMICNLVQKDDFSLLSYQEVLDSYETSPIYPDVISDLFSLAVLISEDKAIRTYSSRLDNALSNNSLPLMREEVRKRFLAYLNMATVYSRMNWFFDHIVKYAEKAIANADVSTPFEVEDCINLLALGQSKTFKLKDAKINVEKIIDSANLLDVSELERNSHLGKYYHTFALLYRASSNENRLEKYYEYQQLSLDYYLKAYGKDSAHMILPYLETAEAAAFKHHGEAIDYYRKAENLCLFYYGAESPQMEECISYLILICSHSHDYEKMNRELERAMPLFASLPKNLHSYNSLDIINGLLWSYQNDTVKVNLLKAEVALKRQFHGANSSLAYSLEQMGSTYCSLKNYSEAETCYLEALDLFLTKYKEAEKTCDKSPVMRCYDGLWNCYYSRKQYEESYQYASMAVKYYRGHGLQDKGHWTEKELGLSAWKTGRTQEAADNLMLFYKSEHSSDVKKSHSYKIIIPAMRDLGLL